MHMKKLIYISVQSTSSISFENSLEVLQHTREASLYGLD